MQRVGAGERLSPDEIAGLVDAPDILPLGMLADVLRRRLHGDAVTYVRVALCAIDQIRAEAVSPAAREVRLTGAPATLSIAVSALSSARAIAGGRPVSGFSWGDIERLARAGTGSVPTVLDELHAAGLDAVAELPMDRIDRLDETVDWLTAAGFSRLRLTVEAAAAAERPALFLRAAAVQARSGAIQAINPLPMALNSIRPTTGYSDVKMVAIARLAAPNVAMIHVDWLRYGPKLAQVALTFGADDLDNCPASDDAPDGKRRAPLEEIRRNIEAAGFTPVERDGRFTLLG